MPPSRASCSTAPEACFRRLRPLPLSRPRRCRAGRWRACWRSWCWFGSSDYSTHTRAAPAGSESSGLLPLSQDAESHEALSQEALSQDAESQEALSHDALSHEAESHDASEL